jgi:hypothetical protein
MDRGRNVAASAVPRRDGFQQSRVHWRGENKGTRFGPERYKRSYSLMRRIDMRPLLLWMLGIPIPILILLYLFGVV